MKPNYEVIKPVQGEEKYVDYDEPTALWCVFGTDSGFAYSSHASEEQAEEQLRHCQPLKITLPRPRLFALVHS